MPPVGAVPVNNGKQPKPLPKGTKDMKGTISNPKVQLKKQYTQKDSQSEQSRIMQQPDFSGEPSSEQIKAAQAIATRLLARIAKQQEENNDMNKPAAIAPAVQNPPNTTAEEPSPEQIEAAQAIATRLLAKLAKQQAENNITGQSILESNIKNMNPINLKSMSTNQQNAILVFVTERIENEIKAWTDTQKNTIKTELKLSSSPIKDIEKYVKLFQTVYIKNQQDEKILGNNGQDGILGKKTIEALLNPETPKQPSIAMSPSETKTEGRSRSLSANLSTDSNFELDAKDTLNIIIKQNKTLNWTTMPKEKKAPILAFLNQRTQQEINKSDKENSEKNSLNNISESTEPEQLVKTFQTVFLKNQTDKKILGKKGTDGILGPNTAKALLETLAPSSESAFIKQDTIKENTTTIKKTLAPKNHKNEKTHPMKNITWSKWEKTANGNDPLTGYLTEFKEATASKETLQQYIEQNPIIWLGGKNDGLAANQHCAETAVIILINYCYKNKIDLALPVGNDKFLSLSDSRFINKDLEDWLATLFNQMQAIHLSNGANGLFEKKPIQAVSPGDLILNKRDEGGYHVVVATGTLKNGHLPILEGNQLLADLKPTDTDPKKLEKKQANLKKIAAAYSPGFLDPLNPPKGGYAYPPSIQTKKVNQSTQGYVYSLNPDAMKTLLAKIAQNPQTMLAEISGKSKAT